MTYTKVIATPEGGTVVEMTPEEIAVRQAEIAEWEAGRIERENFLAEENRRGAYKEESDPLFFKEQAGEVPAGTWQAARQAIKERFPKVEE